MTFYGISVTSVRGRGCRPLRDSAQLFATE